MDTILFFLMFALGCGLGYLIRLISEIKVINSLTDEINEMYMEHLKIVKKLNNAIAILKEKESSK